MPDLIFLGLQARGKMRRFIQSNVLKENTASLLTRRQGACRRCGACCKIFLRCPFLSVDAENQPTCRIYSKRFAQCRLFPLHARDLLELKGQCGFTFEDASEPSISAIPAVAE